MMSPNGAPDLAADRKRGLLSDPAVVIGLIIAYCFAHWLVRLLTSPLYTLDEAEQLLMSQSLDIGYRFRHPPLITWLYAITDRTIGLSRPVFFGLKYVVMAAGLIAFHRAGRLIFPLRRDLAAVSLLAWALVFYPAWGHHEDLTHTVLLFTLLAMTLHAFAAALTRGGWRNWVYLGLTIGFGFLSKYVHAMLPAALILALVATPRSLLAGLGRAGSFPWAGIGVAVATGLAIIAPYVIWMAMNGHSLATLAGQVTAGGDGAHDAAGGVMEAVTGRGRGAIGLALALLEFSLPLTLVFPLVFGAALLKTRDAAQAHGAENLFWRSVLLRAMLIGAAMYGVAVLLGAEAFKARWMHQVLAPLLVWLFLQVERARPAPRAMAVFVSFCAVMVVAVLGARVFEWNADIRTCKPHKCWAYVPVAGWADDLTPEIFSGGTIVSSDYQLSGNLDALLPEARTLDASFEASAFPAPAEGGVAACLAVWRDSPEMPDRLADFLVNDLGVTVADRRADGSFPRLLLKSQTKSTELFWRKLPPSALCR